MLLTFYANECFSLVVLETMQHHLLVVSTNEGGISDMVKDGINGFVCERNDAVSLANSLSSIFRNYTKCC